MSMQRRAFVRDYSNPLIVNVYDVKTKTVAFTGTVEEAAKFMGVSTSNCGAAYRLKTKVKKKWAVRLAPETKSK